MSHMLAAEFFPADACRAVRGQREYAASVYEKHTALLLHGHIMHYRTPFFKRFCTSCGALSAPHNMLCRVAHSPVSRTPHDSQNFAKVFVTGAPQLGQSFGILSALSSRIRFTASVAGIVAAR